MAVAAAGAGDLDRAQELARSISDREPAQARALAHLVKTAGAGDLDRARSLAEQAEAAARAISNPYQQAEALAARGGGGGGRR